MAMTTSSSIKLKALAFSLCRCSTVQVACKLILSAGCLGLRQLPHLRRRLLIDTLPEKTLERRNWEATGVQEPRTGESTT